MAGPQMPAHFPTPLPDYPPAAAGGLLQTLSDRVAHDPFNLVATVIFVLAILHTFIAPRVLALAHHLQHRADQQADAAGRARQPSFPSEILHFIGEVEVVFGLWAVVLLAAITWGRGWDTAKHYLNDTVNYTEPLFVVVIMALASTRPIIVFAERAMSKVAGLGGGTPAAWWFATLTVGPMLGSLVTEPAAMTICALLLARQFYDLQPSPRLKYATLGLLFVNVSIGGTLTHFAAPPILMVARPWGWDLMYVLTHFGWRTLIAVFTSATLYLLIFRKELAALAARPPVRDVEVPDADAVASGQGALLPVPAWIVVAHALFMAWTVVNSHYPALFLGGFLFFLGFVKATSPYQAEISLKSPLLVGFFLAGLVIHGGLQGWWIAPVLASLSETPLFFGAALLTAFNDNALITYLATLVPNMSEAAKAAVVEGAVTGGGLTVIANAPNPAGQALLGRFFGGVIVPLYLLLGALLPTAVAVVCYRLI
ncbi:membrane protein [Luteitalea sp. TBR-22]|uniref:putative Na+/H+ antiporter n=1 Tax=Luteitalea sp. TBR-22 TaxID=2802971 RepID=UPI001AF642C0|nr:putative Na+/H+ antiporter [Luteitalea sp. TBR-22]BCS31851.1 membrane protein [Luteitalea sp. TBR-22]